MEEKKSYSVKELADILGTSITAVQKKIKPDENNPKIKRYKNRFEIGIKDGKTVILLSDAELEEEKRMSKGFKNVTNNVNTTSFDTAETVIDVEPEPVTQQYQNNSIKEILEFTKDYIESYKTLHETFYEELKERDKKINLLTTSENKTKDELAEIQAKITVSEAKTKEFEKRNKLLTLYLTVVSTLLLTFITVYITLNVR